MACGYAKSPDARVSVSRPQDRARIHLLNGLYDAKLDGQPVLAITGLQFHDLIGTHTQQDVALDKLFMDVAVYNERIMGAAHAQNVTELACRTALARRGVAHITIPVDIQDQSVNKDMRSMRNKAEPRLECLRASERGRRASRTASRRRHIECGQKSCDPGGPRRLECRRSTGKVAEILGAPIIKALLGKSCVPDDSPYTTGGLGLLGTLPSEEAMEECDTLLIVGSTLPYIEFYPKMGQAKCVQIDIDPARISLRYPADVALVGDSVETLNALIPRLQQKSKSFLEKAQKGMKEWNELMLNARNGGRFADETAGCCSRAWKAPEVGCTLSPAILEPIQPGGPAMFPRSEAACTPVPEIWLPWPAAFLTR